MLDVVDLDTGAALRAAAVCRAAASDARRVAARIEPSPLRGVWEGAGARAGERDLRATFEALHAEARALEDTADAIEQGIVQARRVEERLAAEHAARRAREQAAAATARTTARRGEYRAAGRWA